MWLDFLTDENLCRVVSHPMTDFSNKVVAQDISFYLDASKSTDIGMGCVYGTRWILCQWPTGFIKTCDPSRSIEYLELYALTAGLLTWQDEIKKCLGGNFLRQHGSGPYD